MKHPKTCYGCRAHWFSRGVHHCELRYELAYRTVGEFFNDPYPKGGECPKPLTLGKLIEASKKAR